MTKSFLVLFGPFVCLVASGCSAASPDDSPIGVNVSQAQGGGGGAPPVQIAGAWQGTLVDPAPVLTIPATMTLTEDAAGNVTGQLCQTQLNGTVLCGPVTGKASAGSFELRGEGLVLKGSLDTVAVTCPAGAIGRHVSGSLGVRGATGSFGFASCS